MRRQLPEAKAFPAGFCDQPEGRLFEIAEPAMDEFRGSAGGTAGEVGLFDQCNPQSAQGRVARDARAKNTAANDEHIEGRVGQGR